MKDIKIVSFSDIHIGHLKVSPERIRLNFKEFIFPEVVSSNLVFSCGDFFHRLLTLGNTSSIEALALIEELLHVVYTNDITLRVLRGTFLHDRLQNTVFSTIANSSARDIDLRCIDTLSVEYIEKYDLKVLYIPDNLPYQSSEEVMEVIHELLKLNSWDSVDLVIGHGYFEHVLPLGIEHIHSLVLRYTDFKDIVNGYILMGHVHTSSVYENIIYNGSFERLNHGEEEDKGFYIVTRTNNTWNYKFIPNLETIKFYTIDVQGNTITDMQNDLNLKINSLYSKDLFGYLRICCNNPEYRQILVKTVSDRYPNIVVSSKSSKSSIDTKKDMIVQELIIKDNIQLTKENIPSYILEHSLKHMESSILTLDNIKSHLQLEE